MKLSDLTLQHKKGLEKSETGSQIDLTSVTLDAEQIRDELLEGAIFDRVTFNELELVHCDLTASHLFDCTFINCKFTHCSFHKAEFHNCQAEHVKFAQCSFTKTEWYGGDFKHAVFAECDFSWSYLQSVDLRYTQFKDVNLEGAVWYKTKVYKSEFDSIDFGSQHPGRIQETDISELGDGTTEVTIEQFRDLLGI